MATIETAMVRKRKSNIYTWWYINYESSCINYKAIDVGMVECWVFIEDTYKISWCFKKNKHRVDTNSIWCTRNLNAKIWQKRIDSSSDSIDEAVNNINCCILRRVPWVEKQLQPDMSTSSNSMIWFYINQSFIESIARVIWSSICWIDWTKLYCWETRGDINQSSLSSKQKNKKEKRGRWKSWGEKRGGKGKGGKNRVSSKLTWGRMIRI